MISVLCCGPCFDERALVEEGALYSFLDILLHSREEKVRKRHTFNDKSPAICCKAIALLFRIMGIWTEYQGVRDIFYDEGLQLLQCVVVGKENLY